MISISSIGADLKKKIDAMVEVVEEDYSMGSIDIAERYTRLSNIYEQAAKKYVAYECVAEEVYSLENSISCMGEQL